MKKLMSKIDFAELVNVSPAAITKACLNKLKDAMVGKRIDANHPDAKNYIKKKKEQLSRKLAQDPDFEKLKKVKKSESEESKISEEYEFKKINPKKTTKIEPKEEKKEPHKVVVQYDGDQDLIKKIDSRNETSFFTNQGREIPEHIRKYLKYTIEDVINEFGTETALNDFLLSIKRIKDIYKIDIANAKESGDLVHKDLIKVGIIDPINTAHTRLLTDGSKTIAKRLVAKHKAGSNIYDLETFVSDQISSYIKPMKQSIRRTLENVEKD